ncbi:GDSL esterase/lipase At3g27950-like [Primulina eburnea]|uniref:GDSL esterase/lipase At3g27950-like n=1 Tax=Primulina eburnea TaxID=1245227 RepID=UPI003C6C5D7B
MDWGSKRIAGGFMGSCGLRRSLQSVAIGVVLFAAYSVLRERTTLGKSTSVCTFSGVYNFGDSNSDTGSASAALGRVPPPYGRTFFGKPSGRYSDGRLIIDFIAEKLGFSYLRAYLDSFGVDFRYGANFASSGSTIQHLDANLCGAGFNPFSLDVQLLQFEQFKARSIESYSQGSESFSKALFTMDSGQNDLHAGLISMNEEQVKADVPRILDQFSVALEKLYKLGARAFWIHNTGPIGCLPYFIFRHTAKPNSTDPNSCIKSYNEVAQEFNKQLKDKMMSLRSQLQDAMLIYVDIYSVKYSLVSDGKNHGFPDPFGYCCGRLGVVKCGEKAMFNGTEVYGDSCSNPLEYISWDGVHYTEAANKWISHRILDGSFSEPKISIAEACFQTL